LVRQVQEVIQQRNRDEGENVDYASLSGHEFKIREMEQQVRFPHWEQSPLDKC
jgi:huntingtin-interacting protein 1-related protein